MLTQVIQELDLQPIRTPVTLSSDGGSLVQSISSWWTTPANVTSQAADATSPEYIKITEDGGSSVVLTTGQISIDDQVREVRLTLRDFRHRDGNKAKTAIRIRDAGNTMGPQWFYNPTGGDANSTYCEFLGGTRNYVTKSTDPFLHSMEEKPTTLIFRLFPNENNGTQWAFLSMEDPDDFIFANKNDGTAMANITDLEASVILSSSSQSGSWFGFTQAVFETFR